MSCFESADDRRKKEEKRQQKKCNKGIRDEIRRDKGVFRTTHRLLLLGNSYSVSVLNNCAVNNYSLKHGLNDTPNKFSVSRPPPVLVSSFSHYFRLFRLSKSHFVIVSAHLSAVLSSRHTFTFVLLLQLKKPLLCSFLWLCQENS